MKVNNVFIQSEFNFYLIYIYTAEAFLATLSKSARKAVSKAVKV